MHLTLNAMPSVQPTRPDTGAPYALRLVRETDKLVHYGDTFEDLARAVLRGHGYPRPGMPSTISTFELMAQARKAFAVELATEVQLFQLKGLGEHGLRSLTTFARQALQEDRSVMSRRPIILWSSPEPLLLVASNYAPFATRYRALNVSYIDDIDDQGLIMAAAAIRGWLLDHAKTPDADSGLIF